jgi:hypothetical protein
MIIRRLLLRAPGEEMGCGESFGNAYIDHALADARDARDDDIIRRGEGAIEATKSANPATRKEAEDF